MPPDFEIEYSYIQDMNSATAAYCGFRKRAALNLCDEVKELHLRRCAEYVKAADTPVIFTTTLTASSFLCCAQTAKKKSKQYERLKTGLIGSDEASCGIVCHDTTEGDLVKPVHAHCSTTDTQSYEIVDLLFQTEPDQDPFQVDKTHCASLTRHSH